MPRALALFTGSLDSMLAVRAVQEQGIDVEAIHVRTLFGCGHAEVEKAAQSLGVPLVTLEATDDYLDVFRKPRFGFGKAKNPCVDCRVHLCRMACRRMQETGANFVVSGEVLGQRSPGQRRKDLEAIAHHSGLGDRLLRPLSAKLLPETEAEREGALDRSRLFAFHGGGRRELIELAKQWRFPFIPESSGGCSAARKPLSATIRDLLDHRPDAGREEFELLRVGRHFRFGEETKIIIGRKETENDLLRRFAAKIGPERAAFFEPKNFTGPSAVVVGPPSELAIRCVAELIGRYGRRRDDGTVAIVQNGERDLEITVSGEISTREAVRVG
jgi:tRNA-uridine 2-sulfurtransferase